MNIKSFFPLCCFSLLCCLSSAAQQNRLGASLGNAFHISAKASGYQIALEYQRKLGPSGAFGVEISQVFQHSRGILPKYIGNQNILLRDYSNYEPFGADANLSLWDKNAFPSIRLSSKPNRYYQFNIGLKYVHQLKAGEKSKLKGGLGLVMSYRDDMELIRLVQTDQVKLTFPGIEIDKAIIPLFAYKTYLDWAIAPELNYQYALGHKLFGGLKAQVLYYPASNDWLLATGVALGVSF